MEDCKILSSEVESSKQQPGMYFSTQNGNVLLGHCSSPLANAAVSAALEVTEDPSCSIVAIVPLLS